MAEPDRRGVLYVVATPIGNLEDITYRAVRILREADLIACEDTRQTRKLLDHYGISRPVVSYHEHNEPERAEELVQKLEGDPGYRVIKLAIESGVTVVPVPGPSALITALVGTGLPTDAFEFRGFFPAKSGQRRTALEGLRGASQTVAVYEAPHRISETLADIVAILGPQRPVVVARELTKIHEEFIRGTAAEVLAQAQQREFKGEITLLIGPAASPAAAAPAKTLSARLEEIVREQKIDEKAALKIAAKERGWSKSEAYRELRRSRKRR
jgi:16S rRNA (cytidine1402-2'-O)-methyltransferase